MSWLVNEAEKAAAAWDARLRGSKATFRDHAAFRAWLKEDAAHQVAHDRLQAALAMLRTHADMPELSALRDTARNTVHDSRRRRVVSVAVAALAVVMIVLVGVSQPGRRTGAAAVPIGETVYATRPGERSRVTLADGSMVTLDSGTRLAARIGGAHRDITLLTGRVLFEVAKDPQRPFIVKAGARTITALGTVFDVRLSAEELRVTLAEGKVAVRPLDARKGAPPQILKPHQQLVIVAGVRAPELRTVDTDNALSWADQQLFFEDERLASAADEINRYSRHKIIIDPAVADLRINGMFRVNNQAPFIEALKITLPVDVRSDGDRTIVSPKRPGRIVGGRSAAM